MQKNNDKNARKFLFSFSYARKNGSSGFADACYTFKNGIVTSNDVEDVRNNIRNKLSEDYNDEFDIIILNIIKLDD